MKNFTSGNLVEEEGVSAPPDGVITASTDDRIAQYERLIRRPPPITLTPASQLPRTAAYTAATTPQLTIVVRKMRAIRA